MSLLELFCHVDDFYQSFQPYWHRHLLKVGHVRRRRFSRLSPSEIMTILIYFHQSHYRNFKAFYTKHVMIHLGQEFPGLVSYNRFVELMPSVTIPLLFYFLRCKGNCSGIAFVDATPIKVCHNRRIRRHKVFAGLAKRGKTSMGWFYGFKLHLIVNDQGEILTFYLSPGNLDDRKPVLGMAKTLFGKLFGDKGYISQELFEQLFASGLELITPIRKNMKNRLMDVTDKLLLRKRAIIETINDQLKNISQIEHTRHRSVHNFTVNLVCGLIAYCHQVKKPSLNLTQGQLQLLSNY
jgi:hypothetical protein|tara:strand:+ start:89 stop:970 length:882 start_codon:yes stop_codon:yes gene_type:complete